MPLIINDGTYPPMECRICQRMEAVGYAYIVEGDTYFTLGCGHKRVTRASVKVELIRT